MAAGVDEVPDLLGPVGGGVCGQALAGGVAAFVAAYLAVRFLVLVREAHPPASPSWVHLAL